ncbi:flagellar biosynthetic protein FliQ [Granulicella rosea]|uniref:Flagellar biosynthetic protein FliQ n=1 Tax=Granulicella rosea TaxID=474952 RepID=A0A239EKF5_9BACT|nr:flagellar biosynthetic protein FliQ [Granulicella rosea]SNS45125.1 flagellar biosynthetic protein FliQ [Granulicella rosea]
MGADQTVQIMRQLMIEAMLLSSPLLLAAALISLTVSLLQTLTSVQEQTLTAVPRLMTVFIVTMVTLPWMIHRLVNYTIHLFSDFHRYIG